MAVYSIRQGDFFHFLGVCIFGDDFFAAGSEVIDNERIIYFFHLIQDRETYYREMLKIETGEPSTGMDLMKSYQAIEIYDDGTVHIIH